MLLQFTTARIIKNHDNGLLQFTIGTLLQIMTTVITIYDRYYNSRQLAVITIHDRYYNLRRYYNSRQYTPPGKLHSQYQRPCDHEYEELQGNSTS